MTRRRAEPRCLALALTASALVAHAQETNRAGVSVAPRLAVSQSWTDNLRLQADAKDAALITTVSPGLRVVSNSGAVRGSLDYALNGITYIKSDQSSRVQHALTASGQAELISRSLFVDVRASIGQQSVSAFGVQSAPTLGSQGSVSTLVNDNQREAGSLTVSPSWRGVLGGVASFELRGDYTRTEVRGTRLGDGSSRGLSLRVSEWRPGLLGWWMDLVSQQAQGAQVRDNSNRAARAGLNYLPDPDLTLSAFVGRERNDYLTTTARQGNTLGGNAVWTPTPRTRMALDWQRHDYGNSHGLSVEHRMARSVWRLSDTESINVGSIGPAGGVRSNYDQFYLLFSSVEPDPVKRDELVRAYLQSQGLSPDAPAAGGFLSAGPSRLRNRSFSMTLQGVRSSLTAQLGQTLTRRLGDNLNVGDLANAARIEQRSYSLTASHQLSPLAGLSVSVSRQETVGDRSNAAAQLTSLVANWNARLGPRLNAQLGARHSRFEGLTRYTENMAYATLTQQF